MASNAWYYEVLYKSETERLEISFVCTCGYIWGVCFNVVDYKQIPTEIQEWKRQYKDKKCLKCGAGYCGRK
jgi:hypothetical protein